MQTAAMPDGKVSSSVVTAEDPGIVFTSKFRRLLTELTRIRDEEPEGECLRMSKDQLFSMILLIYSLLDFVCPFSMNFSKKSSVLSI
jgi:hypothetical protein